MTPPDEADWQNYDWYPLQFNLYISEIQDRYGDTVAEKVRSSLNQGTRPLDKSTYNRWKGPRAHWCQIESEWVWPEANGMTWDEWDAQIKARYGFRHRPYGKRKEDS